MTEVVSDILELRASPETGFSRSVTASLAVHVAGIVALFVAHQYLITRQPPAPKVMTISLGGSTGPRSTGMTAAGARPVDEVAPQPKHEPIKTASAQPDVMTLPVKSEPRHVPPIDRTLPVGPLKKPPTVGQQIQQGTSLAETGSTSQTTGLTVGGAGGSTANLEIADFCCPDYLTTVLQRIEQKWNKTIPGGARGYAVLRFEIERDGSIKNITTDKSTGTTFELQSLSALTQATVPPLPDAFTGDHLVIHLTFPYGIR